jgi:membrane protease YdiL (CAAX protease family)
VVSTAGVFIGFSFFHLVWRTRTDDMMTDGGLLGVLALELAMLLAWLRPLGRRGWSLRGVTHPIEPVDVMTGVSVAFIALIGYWILFAVIAAVSPAYARAASAIHIGGSVSAWVAILVSIVNPCAEELLYLGFVANALRKEGAAVAFSASVLLRVLVHVYQGPLGVISNVPFGAVLAAYYLATGRIWPAILAHSVMDLIALIRFAH